MGVLLEGSFLFLVVLLLIFFVIWIYSSFYLGNYYFLGYFKNLMLWFLVSMVGVLFSKSGLIFLFSWDMLGLSSFFLVFLYMNWDSFSGSMVTVLTNRLGDFFLLVLILLGMGMVFWSMPVVLLSVFCLLAACTKSAQWPFMGWLPKAMSAPTPVSALVHSSTLVTAGVFLIFLFGYFLNCSVLILVFYLGLISMFLASMLALCEKDLKKLVALSTLSQVGLCFMMSGFQFWLVSFFHLLSHALYKSLLFLQVGNLIYTTWGEQESRSYGVKFEVVVSLQMYVSLSGLCGLFFSGGLLSKDFLVEVLFYSKMGMVFSVFLFMILVMTFFYSLKLVEALGKSGGSFLSLNSSSFVFLLSSGLLYFLTFFHLWWMGMNFGSFSIWYLGQEVFVPLLLGVFFLMSKGFSSSFSYNLEYFFKLLLSLKSLFIFMENTGFFLFGLPLGLMTRLKLFSAWVLTSIHLFYLSLVICLFLF